MILTQQYVQSILDYDPHTGEFRWKYRADRKKEWNSRFAYKKTGTIGRGGKSKNFYVLLRIDDVLYKAHRIAWLYFYGGTPNIIDHIDGDGTNNKIANLRDATQSDNLCNRGIQSNNTSGYKGVSFNKCLDKWHAYIKRQGKRHHLGFYESAEKAHTAYIAALPKYHGEFARVA